MTAGGKRAGDKLSLRLIEISVAINQRVIMVLGMNSPFTKHSYKNIRTIAQSDGRLHALKFIRLFHVGNYEQALDQRAVGITMRVRPDIAARFAAWCTLRGVSQSRAFSEWVKRSARESPREDGA